MASSITKPAALPEPRSPSSLRCFIHAITLLFLAAIYSPLSQLKLAPVYGSIPSAQFHHLGTHLIALLALTRPSSFKNWVPKRAPIYLQALACWIPTIQTFISKYSSSLGPTLGPVVTESLTFYPLLSITAYCASSLLVSAQIDKHVHRSLGGTLLGLSAYGLFTAFEASAWRILVWASTLSIYLTRTTFQLLVGVAYFSLSPSKLYIATFLPLLQTLLFDPHSTSPFATSLMNSSLQNQNWTLLERADSITGYVSVLENSVLQYRLLRCDHSLLGGEWLVNDERKKEGITVPEPIYAVFEMLEAIRLIELTGNTRFDHEKNALVIGLGIGTAPKAFIAHGIETTVVEIDPVVHEFATKYFDLPSNHTPVLEDAVSWVRDAAHKGQKYDYIIHDVFTGGAEPLPLFTNTFLQNLGSILSEDGAVALNYAGDLSSSSTRLVLNTINTAFDHQCRMFRDQPPSETSSKEGETDSDFLNMVVFCTKAKGQEIHFRRPTKADFLESRSRQHYLYPRPELELKFPTEKEMQAEKLQVLTTGDLKALERTQFDSAKRHWAIMRKVVPDFVWENW